MYNCVCVTEALYLEVTSKENQKGVMMLNSSFSLSLDLWATAVAAQGGFGL